MQIRAELRHVDTLRCIVRVEAWQDGDLQGSALGEAASAEDAEERAFQRLQARLQTSVNERQARQQAVHKPARASQRAKRTTTNKFRQRPGQTSDRTDSTSRGASEAH